LGRPNEKLERWFQRDSGSDGTAEAYRWSGGNTGKVKQVPSNQKERYAGSIQPGDVDSGSGDGDVVHREACGFPDGSGRTERRDSAARGGAWAAAMEGTADFHIPADSPHYDTVEEVMAIAVSNVYRSEMKRPGLRQHNWFQPVGGSVRGSQEVSRCQWKKGESNLSRMKQFQKDNSDFFNDLKKGACGV
jgi:hypothetical protein